MTDYAARISDADYKRLEFMHSTTTPRLRVLAAFVGPVAEAAASWSDREVAEYWETIDGDRDRSGLSRAIISGFAATSMEATHSDGKLRHLVERLDNTIDGPTKLTPMGVDAFRGIAEVLAGHSKAGAQE